MRLKLRGTTEAPGMSPPPGSGPEPGAPAPQGRHGRRYDPAWNDWNAPRRWPGILLSCVIVLGFLSIVVWHLRPHSTVHHQKAIINPNSPKVLPSFVPPVRGMRAAAFSGTHDMGGLHFLTNGGLLILHARCACQYNFVVTIRNQNLVPIAFPVNDTGSVNSVLDVTLPKGPLIVSVVGLGHWFVQFIQPVATTPAIPTPFCYFSAGNDVIGPFSAANKYVSFQFLSLSNGSVDVHVLNEQGFGIQTPFAGRIALSGSKTLSKLPNRYFLEVDATGLWNLDVRRTPKPCSAAHSP